MAPQAIDAEPCAIVRSFSNGNGEDATRRAYLHLGDAATAVIFAEGSRILFLKYVNRGGIHFDQAVAQHLALPVQEAAQMRDTVLASTNLDPDNEIHQTVIEAIRRPLESLSAEVELCMRYFKVTFRGKPLEKVIVTGSEASPWLVEFFEKNLQTPCELGNPFQSLGHLPVEPELVERPGRWATAIGLSQKQI
ncbi:MAG: pilus assembly protein PilM [Planctomycetes bacterium]|nr:pilus assembly protein PilM [Planctomycetota bacterium]